MTWKLELNDWEALAVEVALVTLQEKWIEEKKAGRGPLVGGEVPAMASLQTLIDKIWRAKGVQDPEQFIKEILPTEEARKAYDSRCNEILAS
jgi:hypothetical protein